MKKHSNRLRYFVYLSALLALGLTCPILEPPGSPDDYFPLAVGNTWIYRWPYGAMDTVAITDKMRVGGETYFVVDQWYGARRQFRQTKQKEIVEHYQGKTGVWYRFAAPIDSVWTIPDINPQGHTCYQGITVGIDSTGVTVQVPAGRFENCIRIVTLRSKCVDAGIVVQWFAPGVGLVARLEDSFAGWRRVELIRARVNGVSYPR